jgi:hypothetical protein
VFVYVCAFFCVCVQVEALRRADHPSKESYRLSLIKKLMKLSLMLQKREQAPKCGSNEEGKKMPLMGIFQRGVLNQIFVYNSCFLKPATWADRSSLSCSLLTGRVRGAGYAMWDRFFLFCPHSERITNPNRYKPKN